MTEDLDGILSLVECGWRNAPVLVVGDVMLDKYIWGDVERISPEAPVPVLRAAKRNERPGGAANVAMNLAGLGACVTLVGFTGDDWERDRLESLLLEAEVEPRLITQPGAATITKLRILARHQQIVRVDSEPLELPEGEACRRALNEACEMLPRVAVLVLSDYAKGALSQPVCQGLIAEANKLGIPVLVDPKGNNFGKYRGATAICPNLSELSAATGEPPGDLRRLLSAGQAMVECLELQCMTVTLGEKGITLLRSNSQTHAPAAAREVFDVSGAGDTVISVLALAMACGVEMEAALAVANLAAGIVVSQPGTVAIQRHELLGALAKEGSLQMHEKVLSIERLFSRASGWRASGERIVFTNGCFDILHIGHIQLLEQARRKGDRLIVGLNSDNSVRRLKGAARPVVGEAERARILAALSAVDAVTIFSEDTPLKMIEAIRPDILVKGGDYKESNVVGAREVRAWGGRVELIPLIDGVSTTALLSKSTAAVPAAYALPAQARVAGA